MFIDSLKRVLINDVPFRVCIIHLKMCIVFHVLFNYKIWLTEEWLMCRNFFRLPSEVSLNHLNLGIRYLAFDLICYQLVSYRVQFPSSRWLWRNYLHLRLCRPHFDTAKIYQQFTVSWWWLFLVRYYSRIVSWNSVLFFQLLLQFLVYPLVRFPVSKPNLLLFLVSFFTIDYFWHLYRRKSWVG